MLVLDRNKEYKNNYLIVCYLWYILKICQARNVLAHEGVRTSAVLFSSDLCNYHTCTIQSFIQHL